MLSSGPQIFVVVEKRKKGGVAQTFAAYLLGFQRVAAFVARKNFVAENFEMGTEVAAGHKTTDSSPSHCSPACSLF